jgi:hypothetical protein
MTDTTDPKSTKTTKLQPSKLFHAVVLAGVALVGGPGISADRAMGDGNTATNITESTALPATCPPGSERPYPPCFWIK